MNTKKRTLILVIPPQIGLLRGFATGLISLATYINQNLPTINVDIIDLSAFSHESVEAAISKLSYSDFTFIGITTTTASYQSSLFISKLFKKYLPKSILVWGGHHASNDFENILRNHRNAVDFIIRGEGEIALSELLDKYPNIEHVPNLVYLDEKDQLQKNENAPFLTSQVLDTLSLSYEETSLYGSPGKFDSITYVSARGCPLKCAFCAVANEKMRSKSVEKVVEDIRKLAVLGYKKIAIEDNFFAHSPKRTKDICTQLKHLRENEGFDFTWDCQTRVESVTNPEIVTLMADAGCHAAYLGVEALNKEHILYLGKSFNPEKYIEKLRDIVVPNFMQTTMDCFINIQLGIPNETQAHVDATIARLTELGRQAMAFGKCITVFLQLHVVYPGTQHFRQGIQQQRFGKDVFEHYTIWEVSSGLLFDWQGENFAHGQGGLPEGLLNKKLLIDNKFALIPERVQFIKDAIEQIKQIAGICVFNYSNHLIEKV